MEIKKQNSILSIIIRILVPIIVVLIALFLISFHNLASARILAYKYMLDTAELFVEDITSDIEKISSEVFHRCESNPYSQKLPDQITPREVKNYKIYKEIVEDNKTLTSRYGSEYTFYVYSREADFLVSGTGIFFKNGYESELSKQMRTQLKELDRTQWNWDYIYAEGKTYLMHAYAKEEYVFGFYIELELLLANLELNNMGYQMLPYIRLEGDDLVSTSGYTNIDEVQSSYQSYKNKNKLLSDEFCIFPVSDIFEIEMVLLPSDGVIEEIVTQQSVLLIISMILVLILGYGGCYLYLRLLRPMKEFLAKLEKSEEELILNNTDSFNILELEMLSKEFKELLRRIKTLKISIYEKELLYKQVQLEYVQEQIQPHFYLNCLSILHAMAEKNQDRQMVHLLELLSRYMRYVINDSYKMKKIGDELAHLEDYIEIQQLRYKNAFTYEADVEECILEYFIPALMLQVFVENAIKHAVSLEQQIDISLYITTEMLDGEEYLYVTISDTGAGFTDEILKDIEADRPIIYDNRKHIGIANAKQRLQLIYGNKADMKLSNMAPGYGAVVELTIPLTRNEEGNRE